MVKRGNKRKHTEVSGNVQEVKSEQHVVKNPKKFKKNGESEKASNLNIKVTKNTKTGKQSVSKLAPTFQTNKKKKLNNRNKKVVKNIETKEPVANKSNTSITKNSVAEKNTQKNKSEKPLMTKMVEQASVNGTSEGSTTNTSKKFRKRKRNNKTKLLKKKETASENEEVVPPKPHSEKARWSNKQRVMVFCTRGIGYRDRHLMEDLKKLMPHHKPEPKMERSKTLSVINEMCEIKNCNKVLLFEGRKKTDLYMWMSSTPHGPSIKFLVENIHTMSELKLTGNCLRGSRPLLSFDESFNQKTHYKLLKEILCQVFGVPKHHPKSQPFFDHVFTFTVADNKVWFRNFQILSEDGALAEIGPRFVLNPIKIFSGSFGGIPLWENNKYVTPALLRRQLILAQKKNLYVNKKENKLYSEATKPTKTYELNPLDIFENETE